eukprot:TRINITY_DN31227_c0_g1_i1.p1 TRINITY_DN31227_c0_g1~~TRINITY_DN31227_c0_g1_i1.p1  ORF type:complete len:302 (+),score=17.49 TRINITY_DN31227_c0_g1_i1:88-906(+)
MECNPLLQTALHAIGFSSRLAVARVLLGPSPSAFSHFVVLVNLRGEDYLVDVGFGRASLRVPVPLSSLLNSGSDDEHAVVVSKPLLTYPDVLRLADDKGTTVAPGGIRVQSFDTQAWTGAGMPELSSPSIQDTFWKDQYVFHPRAPVFNVDVEVTNWGYATQRPGNPWCTQSFVVALTSDGRKILNGNTFSLERRENTQDLQQLFSEHHFVSKPVGSCVLPILRQKKMIPDHAWFDVLRREFNIDLAWDYHSDTLVELTLDDFLAGARWNSH